MASANLVEKLSDLKNTNGSASVELPGRTLYLEGLQADSLSCRLTAATVRSNRREDNLSAVQVKAWANSIAGKVTGLLESLRVLEVDETQAVALLRSEKPAVRTDEVLYYEAMLKADLTCELRRYAASTGEGKPRQSIPFTLTHESLAKFVDDVAV